MRMDMRLGLGSRVAVVAQDRTVQRASATNQTGASKTVAVGFFSSSTNTTQTFTRMWAVIWK